MQTTAAAPAFISLQNQVKNQLADFFDKGKIRLEELMAILYLFSFTETVEELQNFILLFGDSFPVLQDLAVKQEASTKQSLDQSLAVLVQNVLKKDPVLAVKLGKEASQKGVTMEQILEKYPEARQYI